MSLLWEWLATGWRWQLWSAKSLARSLFTVLNGEEPSQALCISKWDQTYLSGRLWVQPLESQLCLWTACALEKCWGQLQGHWVEKLIACVLETLLCTSAPGRPSWGRMYSRELLRRWKHLLEDSQGKNSEHTEKEQPPKELWHSLCSSHSIGFPFIVLLSLLVAKVAGDYYKVAESKSCFFLLATPSFSLLPYS